MRQRVRCSTRRSERTRLQARKLGRRGHAPARETRARGVTWRRRAIPRALLPPSRLASARARHARLRWASRSRRRCAPPLRAPRVLPSRARGDPRRRAGRSHAEAMAPTVEEVLDGAYKAGPMFAGALFGAPLSRNAQRAWLSARVASRPRRAAPSRAEARVAGAGWWVWADAVACSPDKARLLPPQRNATRPRSQSLRIRADAAALVAAGRDCDAVDCDGERGAPRRAGGL